MAEPQARATPDRLRGTTAALPTAKRRSRCRIDAPTSAELIQNLLLQRLGEESRNGGNDDGLFEREVLVEVALEFHRDTRQVRSTLLALRCFAQLCETYKEPSQGVFVGGVLAPHRLESRVHVGRESSHPRLEALLFIRDVQRQRDGKVARDALAAVDDLVDRCRLPTGYGVSERYEAPDAAVALQKQRAQVSGRVDLAYTDGAKHALF